MSLREVFDLLGRVTGRDVRVDLQPVTEGRHARYLRGHDAARADLGFAPSVDAGGGPARDVSVDGSESSMKYGWTLVVVVALLGATVLACAKRPAALPPGTAEADKFLFERGEAAVKDEKWVDAREYFRNIVDNYPQSPFRPDAKLALGDTYLSQGGTENLLLAANEFREFQTFYPTHPRADYAQLQLARSYTRQMLAPERDQSATRDAIKEIEVFLQRYPNSCTDSAGA